MSEDSKHDALLKRIQIILAILTGLIGLAVGGYNVKKSFFVPTGPGAIMAIVENEKGAPIAGAKAEIYGGQNALVAALSTKEDGQIMRKDLDPGPYTLKVQAKGFETKLMTVQVNAKKTSDLEVVMEAAPTSTNSPIKSALEEVGASWIKNIAKPKSESPEAVSTN